MNQERFDQAPRNIYEDGSSIDIIKLFKSIISKLWIILLVGVVGAAAGYIKQVRLTPMFRSIPHSTLRM